MQNYKPKLKFLMNLLVMVFFCASTMSFSIVVISAIDGDIDIELLEFESEEDTPEKEQFEEKDFEAKKMVLDFTSDSNNYFINSHIEDNYYIKKAFKEMAKDIPSPPPELV